MSQMQLTRNALQQASVSPEISPKKSPLNTDILDLSQKVSPCHVDSGLSFSGLFSTEIAPRLVMPFSRDCGMNLEISQDGYRASRIRGCRQSVAVGSAPLTLV